MFKLLINLASMAIALLLVVIGAVALTEFARLPASGSDGRGVAVAILLSGIALSILGLFNVRRAIRRLR